MPGSRRLITFSTLASSCEWSPAGGVTPPAGFPPFALLLVQNRLQLAVDPVEDRLRIGLRQTLQLLVEVTQDRGDVRHGRDRVRVVGTRQEGCELRVELAPLLRVRLH